MGHESFRQQIVSTMSQFRPEIFGPGLIQPNLMGRFGLLFYKTSSRVALGGVGYGSFGYVTAEG